MGLTFSKQIRIADRIVGDDSPIFIIAEAGVAHFGNVEKALALVDMAVAAKADAVKFQIFKRLRGNFCANILSQKKASFLTMYSHF